MSEEVLQMPPVMAVLMLIVAQAALEAWVRRMTTPLLQAPWRRRPRLACGGPGPVFQSVVALTSVWRGRPVGPHQLISLIVQCGDCVEVISISQDG